MGEPAEMSAHERFQTVELAKFIVDRVTNDTGDPTATVQLTADLYAVPAETLILWLATLVLKGEAKRALCVRTDADAKHDRILIAGDLINLHTRPFALGLRLEISEDASGRLVAHAKEIGRDQ